MKLFILTVISLLSIQAIGQGLEIEGKFEEQPLWEVIMDLEKRYGLTFNYEPMLVAAIQINTIVKKQPLKMALEQLFQSTNLTFKIIDKTSIVLIPKKQPSLMANPKSKPKLKQISICGQVFDNLTKSPMEFVNVFIRGTSKGITTDNSGEFKLSGYFSPSDTVEISYIGYEYQRLPVEKFLKDCPTIQLNYQAFIFERVIVKDYLTDGIHLGQEYEPVELNISRLQTIPGFTEPDILQSTQLLPGVSSPTETATGVHIRGGTPDQNLVLWDGIPMYNTGHFFGMLSPYNPFVVEDVEVYRSGFNPKYGGRVSGVIDIKTKNKIPEKANYDIGVNFTHIYANVKLPINKKNSLVLSSRRSYIDIYQSTTYNQWFNRVFQTGKVADSQDDVEELPDSVAAQVSFVYEDYNAKWLFRPNNKDEISWSGYYGRNIFDFRTSDEDLDFGRTSDKLNWKNYGMSGKWKRQWTPNYQSELNLIYSDYQSLYEFELVSDEDTSEVYEAKENLIQDLTIKWHNDYQLSMSHNLQFGYQFSQKRLNFDLDIDYRLGEDVDIEEAVELSFINSLYGSYTYNQSKKWLVNLGIRLNHYDLTEAIYFEPRFSIRYFPTDHLQLKATGGSYLQFISQLLEFNDLGVNYQTWIMAIDSVIPVLKGTQFSTGVLWKHKGYTIDIEGYVKTLSGLTSMALNYGGASLEERPFDVGMGTIWGLDVLVRKQWKGYKTWLGASTSSVFYSFEEIDGGQKFPASHHQRFTFKWIQLFSSNNWHFSTAWYWNDGLPYTQPAGILEEEDDTFIDFPTQNNGRLDVTHRLDLSILYNIVPKSGKWKGKVGVSIFNVYNQYNAFARNFFIDEDENEVLIVEDLERHLLEFTPNFSFRMVW